MKIFRKSGHFPSLLSAFLYFDVSFMIGDMRFMLVLYSIVALCAFAISTFPGSFLVMLVLTNVMMACLGMGKGLSFKSYRCVFPRKSASSPSGLRWIPA